MFWKVIELMAWGLPWGEALNFSLDPYASVEPWEVYAFEKKHEGLKSLRFA